MFSSKETDVSNNTHLERDEELINDSWFKHS